MGKLELHTVEVHIWKLRWRELETFWNRYKPILEKEECQKAKHYRFHEDKMRYLAGKIAVRMFLKEYSGEDKIVLRQGKYGKLYWKAPPGQRKITFNLSHSGEWVLAIFASRQAVGIDVQEMGEISEYMEIAKNFFTEEEAAEIQETESPERFYQYWAAREAHLKALGIGLNKGMDFFSVRENKIIEKGKIKSGWKLYPIQYSVEMRKKILAQTILFYMNKKGVLLKDIPCTLNQILKCLSVNTDNNDIIYRWIELLKKYNYVTETDGIYVCKIEIYEKGLKYGWEEVEYLWKGKLESPLVLDYIINNIKNWDKLIQKEQQATLLLFEQGEDIYADALYKETKILQYLNHSLSKKVLGYLYENANATILEIGAGTGATSDKVLSDIRENKFEEHIVYFYTDISRFFLQRAKERYKECDGKIEMHYQTLDIDEAFSSQLPSNFQADIVIAVGVLNNSVNTDKCIYEINSVMKPGGILLIIETVEDVPDILITQSFMMTEPKDQRKATNTMFLNRKQWLEILEENGFCNSEEFPGYGEYLEVLGQKLFYCTKE